MDLVEEPNFVTVSKLSRLCYAGHLAKKGLSWDTQNDKREKSWVIRVWRPEQRWAVEVSKDARELMKYKEMEGFRNIQRGLPEAELVKQAH